MAVLAEGSDKVFLLHRLHASYGILCVSPFFVLVPVVRRLVSAKDMVFIMLSTQPHSFFLESLL